MTTSKLFSGLAIALALTSGSASASSYSFDYVYDGSVTTTTHSSAGSVMTIGDSLQVSFSAAGDGYWTAEANTGIWTPQGFDESGVRTGNLMWAFYNDNVLVDSGYQAGQSSMWVHVPQFVTTSKDVTFDKMVWSYFLTASTASGNTLNGWTFGESSLAPAKFTAAVPEPESYAMFLAGFALLGAIARRRKNQ